MYALFFVVLYQSYLPDEQITWTSKDRHSDFEFNKLVAVSKRKKMDGRQDDQKSLNSKCYDKQIKGIRRPYRYSTTTPYGSFPAGSLTFFDFAWV